ncbi:hypothetical protein BO70DRAFT_390059 [Aspergillus heteromorphus CBS 117.55]|uniref:Rhodopsin domain-containing protein n=1 Tax=Aspergillus heteromorphus CBS 117.55 TaxID=1448321 RepID=A0A317V8V7_9EURO|nr:uncharacterized protein BO70DRAFT_390059 [Aspergillus heteromorphus CBS 117.55]PWY69799.1 hypothetical protein BO70DRAFT_390059 [Aspergillus heteromorphus CBS 117.55]
MAGPASSLPPGVSSPLTEDNDYNHNGLIVIITSLSLFLILASLGIRLFASSKRGHIFKDDYVLFVVAACACVQVSLVLVQVHYGWGKSGDLISAADYAPMEKAGYVADLLYVLGLGLSKACTMIFYQNLSLQRTRWMINLVLSACAVWAIVAMMLLAIRCSTSRPWSDINRDCSGLFPRWQAICALEIVLETMILSYPAIAISNVQISLSKKLKVLAILSCRVILIPLSAIHLYYIHWQIQSPNPSLIGTYATTVAELHLSVSVVLLTLSCLKIFIAVYVDDHGLAYTEDASNPHSYSGRTPPKSWQSCQQTKDLSSFGSGCNEDEPILRTEASVSASSGQHANNDGTSILKSVQISVTRENIELAEIQGSSNPGMPRPT